MCIRDSCKQWDLTQLRIKSSKFEYKYGPSSDELLKSPQEWLTLKRKELTNLKENMKEGVTLHYCPPIVA